MSNEDDNSVQSLGSSGQTETKDGPDTSPLTQSPKTPNSVGKPVRYPAGAPRNIVSKGTKVGHRDANGNTVWE